MKKKLAIERDLIDLTLRRKSISEVQSSLVALQNILVPRQNPGIGLDGKGNICIAPNNCIQLDRGVVGPTEQFVGYNEHGQFFATPTSAAIFSGIEFNNGQNTVIISSEEAKSVIKNKCTENISKASPNKKTQLSRATNKIKSKIQIYGPYVDKKTNQIHEGVELDGFWEMINDVLKEHSEMTPEQKKEHYRMWDIAAHGFDSSPDKWKQHKFNDLSTAVKDSYEEDVFSALICRAVKDAIFCFDHQVSTVNGGHAHKFNTLLDEIDAIYAYEAQHCKSAAV